jgi:hypothetical protein
MVKLLNLQRFTHLMFTLYVSIYVERKLR